MGKVFPSGFQSFTKRPFSFRGNFNLVRYEAEIHKLSLNSFSEIVYLLSKSYELK